MNRIFFKCKRWHTHTHLEGFPVVQRVAGVVHGVDGEVEEGAGRAQVEVERDEATLDEPVGVSVQVVVHHEAWRKNTDTTTCLLRRKTLLPVYYTVTADVTNKGLLGRFKAAQSIKIRT